MNEEVRVFISYSHDSAEHAARVLSLSERLRCDGIDTILDRYVEGSPAEGWPRWMMNQLDCASSVLVVCTEVYYKRFLGHEVPHAGRGVDWEGSLITLEQYGAKSKTRKFVPVTFSGQDEKFIPPTLGGQTAFTLESESAYQSLCAVLLGQSGIKPRPVSPRVQRAAVVVEPMRFPDAAPAKEQPRLETADIHPAAQPGERSAAVQESAPPSPSVLSTVPGGSRSGRFSSHGLKLLAAASAVAVTAVVGLLQPGNGTPSPLVPSPKPPESPDTLRTLAAKMSAADVAACSALLSELGLSLVASAYGFGPESDGWAHECELSKYKPAAETRSPVDVIVQKRGGWQEHDPSDVDPELRKAKKETAPESEDAEAPEEEWIWSLNTLKGAREGSRLSYVAYLDGTPKALRVLAAYGADNYCQSTPPRQRACGSWGMDKPLWIFGDGKKPAFQLNALTRTLHGAFPDAHLPVSGTWFRDGARLAFWGSSGVQLCGELLDSSEDEADWSLELWPAKSAGGSLEVQCLKERSPGSVDVLERD